MRAATLTFAIAAALLAIAPLALLGAAPDRLAIRATPIALDPGDPGRRTIGALDYLGGWQLESDDRRFGGLSSLTLQRGRLVAIADDGVVVSFAFAAGRARDPAIFELPDGPGSDRRKRDRDSESSTYDPATGRTWVGFETTNEIWRYGPDFAHAEGHVAPPAMRDWPGNRGAEAMTRLADGRFLVIEETPRGDGGSHHALLFAGDPTLPATPPPLRFGYLAPTGFNVTDAAVLPDGRVLVLHRRASIFNGLSAAITIVDPTAIRAGATLSGREIARIAPPLNVDNMEGIAIVREARRTVLWLVSDDNFTPIQRTLLLKFALREP